MLVDFVNLTDRTITFEVDQSYSLEPGETCSIPEHLQYAVIDQGLPLVLVSQLEAPPLSPGNSSFNTLCIDPEKLKAALNQPVKRKKAKNS